VHPSLRLVWAGGYTLYMCERAMFRKAFGSSDEVVRDLTKEWALGLSSRMQIDVRTYGADAVDWSVPYVLMANHQSYLDVLALYTALPRCFGIVAKKGLFGVPLFGGVMRALGCVPVDRTKRAEAMRVMRETAEEVRRNERTIAIFPEGTRGSGECIGKLKKGPFHLAELAKLPTLPIGIRGTAALMPRANTGIRPGVVEVHVGRPIAPISGATGKSRNAAMEQMRLEIARLAGVSTEIPAETESAAAE
jgi:1-acyl-sn-glycerol-3-phosphate acyltransferase